MLLEVGRVGSPAGIQDTIWGGGFFYWGGQIKFFLLARNLNTSGPKAEVLEAHFFIDCIDGIGILLLCIQILCNANKIGEG
jgi:hypothetical protein